MLAAKEEIKIENIDKIDHGNIVKLEQGDVKLKQEDVDDPINDITGLFETIQISSSDDDDDEVIITSEYYVEVKEKGADAEHTSDTDGVDKCTNYEYLED